MGYCVCTVGIPGKTLNFTWVEGNNTYSWHGPAGYCNPYNCSNAKCKSNGCANARDGFCGRFGKTYCAGLRRNVCVGEKCLGAKPIPRKGISDGDGGTTTPKPTPASQKTACQQRLGVDADCCNYGNLGGFGEWWCIQGKSATKGLQAGGVLAGDIGNQVGKWMPVILAGFAGLALILVFKQF